MDDIEYIHMSLIDSYMALHSFIDWEYLYRAPPRVWKEKAETLPAPIPAIKDRFHMPVKGVCRVSS